MQPLNLNWNLTLCEMHFIPDEHKDLAKLLTGYQDMVGLLHVHKVARINTQVGGISLFFYIYVSFSLCIFYI